jgi:hypothetical protein
MVELGSFHSVTINPLVNGPKKILWLPERYAAA